MPQSLARSTDIATFLREMRRATRHGAEQLEELTEQRHAAARRFERLQRASELSFELVEEMKVRDEELRATADELGQQLDSVRHAAALLERERSKYMDLFEHAPDAYIVTNLAGTIEEANVAAGILFDAEARFLRGRSMITFVARGDTDTFRSLLRRLQTLDQSSARDTVRAVLRMRPRGQPVFVAFAHVGILCGANDRPLALRWVLRRFDVDEEVDAERSGTREELADFAGSLAEDLRAPLVPIIEWARCLREWDVCDEEERRKALGWIERSAQSQQAKLDELAEFARAYREGPEAEVTDVVEIAERAARAEGEWSRIVLRCETAPGPVHVVASGLARAVELFLQRALDGTPRQVSVELRVRAHGSEASLDVVAPDGAGIPDGWTVRTATATRIIERSGGRVMLADGSPSARVRLRRLSL